VGNFKLGMQVQGGNASAEVKASSTYVTITNEDEGFAKVREDFVLKVLSAQV
jgi:hydroxymethylpyrimidine pyrophosphatase-like HAD family hydrolase